MHSTDTFLRKVTTKKLWHDSSYLKQKQIK